MYYMQCEFVHDELNVMHRVGVYMKGDIGGVSCCAIPVYVPNVGVLWQMSFPLGRLQLFSLIPSMHRHCNIS